MRLVERDPAARDALERVRTRLRAIADAFQSPDFQRELERSKRERQGAVERLAWEVRAALVATGDELAARGITAPQTLEEWEHLARVIELPFETIRAGEYTLRDVYDMALAWLDRQAIIRRSAAAGTRAGGGREGAARAFTIAALRELTGLKNAALNKYAKLAEVKTPRRGQRDFRYGAADVRAILNAIISNTSERAVLSQCRNALRSLPEIVE